MAEDPEKLAALANEVHELKERIDQLEDRQEELAELPGAVKELTGMVKTLTGLVQGGFKQVNDGVDKVTGSRTALLYGTGIVVPIMLALIYAYVSIKTGAAAPAAK